MTKDIPSETHQAEGDQFYVDSELNAKLIDIKHLPDPAQRREEFAKLASIPKYRKQMWSTWVKKDSVSVEIKKGVWLVIDYGSTDMGKQAMRGQPDADKEE